MQPAFSIQTGVVDVTNWPRDEEFPVFPVGSKPKRMLVCPSNAPASFLVPGHAYLFKTGAGRFQYQVWSEVIAYRIGALVGLPVPPCFIAIDKIAGETGALVEFFYGYPEEASPARFIHASDFMTRLLVDKKRGRPHRLIFNLVVSGIFCGKIDALEWWAKALAFDTLIGNTDRHPDNWGFVFRHQQADQWKVSLSPLFDNGTSLGYEIDESKLCEARRPERIEAYINRGKHHCGWHKDDGPFGHFDLCREFVHFTPNAAHLMREVLNFELSDVLSLLDECASYETGIKFSKERAALVFSLVEARKSTLAGLLEG